MPTFQGGLAQGLQSGLGNLIQLLALQDLQKRQQEAQNLRLLQIKANLNQRGLDLAPGPGGQFQIVPSQQAIQVQQTIAPLLEGAAGLQQARNLVQNQGVAADPQQERRRQESIAALDRQVQAPLAQARQSAIGSGIRGALRPVEAAMQQEESLQQIRQRQLTERRQAMQDKQEFGKQKLELFRAIQGIPGAPEARKQISQAETMDDLLDIVADLQAFDRLSVQDASPARIALMAARGDADALKALRLLNERQRSTTLATLVKDAASGDQIAKDAIELLKEIRSTGVKSSRRREREESGSSFLDLPSQPQGEQEPPPLEPLPGGGIRGQGTTPPATDRPRVKSFRRVD